MTLNIKAALRLVWESKVDLMTVSISFANSSRITKLTPKAGYTNLVMPLSLWIFSNASISEESSFTTFKFSAIRVAVTDLGSTTWPLFTGKR